MKCIVVCANRNEIQVCTQAFKASIDSVKCGQSSSKANWLS